MAPAREATRPLASTAGAHFDLNQSTRARVRAFYDELGRGREQWIARSRYYYDGLIRLLRFIVPAGQRVLDVGCGTGEQLAALEPSCGVGVDLSQGMVDLAREMHPHLELHCQAAEELLLPAHEASGFDFVIMVNVIGELADVLAALKRLHPLVRADTRLVLVYYNHLWEPLVGPAARLGLKLDDPTQNWLSPGEIRGLLHLAGFEPVKSGLRMPCPKYVPGLAPLANDVLGRLPLLERLDFVRFVLARPNVPLPRPPNAYSATVVVPCKNEEGNVAAIPARDARDGRFHADRLRRRPERRCHGRAGARDHRRPSRSSYQAGRGRRSGQGRGRARRSGGGDGDVLMILDADMAVMPEDLPAFFEAITQNKGELVIGTRLVYPLGAQAMRTANILGNKLFAWAFTFLLEQPLTDTLCGTKVVMRHNYDRILAARAMFGDVDRWGDYDWIFGAAKCNLRIVEIPVHYVERMAGKTKMEKRLGNAMVMLRMCWLALRRLRLG